MTVGAQVGRTGGESSRTRGLLGLMGGAALVGTLGGLALPAVLGRAVDAIVGGVDSTTWLAVAAALIVLGAVCDIVEMYAETACVARTTAHLRGSLIRHVLAIGPDRARRFETGDLVSRVSSNAVDAAQSGPSLVSVVTATLPPLGSLLWLAYVDIWLAVAFVAGLVLVGLVLAAFTRHTTDALTGYQETLGGIAGRLSESLGGIRTIAAAGSATREEHRILEALPALHSHGVRTWRVLARSVAQSSVAGPLVPVAVLIAAGIELARGRVTPGELFAAGQYALLGVGLGGLTAVFGGLARARAGRRRLAAVFGEPELPYGVRDSTSGAGRLEFRGVTVRSGDATLLDVDLTLPGGASIAVVGPSGSGKSLLGALAARLREPTTGAVLLDDVPLQDLSRDAVRTAIGCAFERPVLVGRTVEDAIGLGDSSVRTEDSARAAFAHDFVVRLPSGYRTPLPEAPMSGGEAQRLGIARAWRAERLLVLDDATSSLDAVTEMQIGRALTDDPRRRTRLIITHRMSTAARADFVVWLVSGRVRGFGTHRDLVGEPDYREAFG